MKYILMLDPNKSNKVLINYDFVREILKGFNDKKPEIKEIKDEENMYSHIFSFEQGYFEMFLNKEMNAITLEGDWKKTIEFIDLFIKLLPKKQEIHLLDSAYNDNMIITSQTKLSDIKDVFGG